MPLTSVVILASGSVWTVPADFNPDNNTIHAIGAGSSGAAGTTTTGGVGGVGANYSRLENFDPLGASTIAFRLGVANGTVGPGIAPTSNTWLRDASTLVAAGRAVATTNSVGTQRFGGGAAGANLNKAAGGGGGAGGPNAAGVAGANAPNSSIGGAGGVGDGGGGGVGGVGGAGANPGAPGALGLEFAGTHGSGGGGGGAGGSPFGAGFPGGAGGLYGSSGGGGGGGPSGGGAGGLGKGGIIVIVYVAVVPLGQSNSEGPGVKSLAHILLSTLVIPLLPPAVVVDTDLSETQAPQPSAPFVPINLRTAVSYVDAPPIVAGLLAFMADAGEDPLPQRPFVPVALRTSFSWVEQKQTTNAATPATYFSAGGDPLPRRPFMPLALREGYDWSELRPPAQVPINFLFGGREDKLPKTPFVPVNLRTSYGNAVGSVIFSPMAVTPTRLFFTDAKQPSVVFPHLNSRSSITPTLRVPFTGRIEIVAFTFIDIEDIVPILNELINEINENLGLLSIPDSNFVPLFRLISMDQLTNSVNQTIVSTNKRLVSLGVLPELVIRQFVLIPADSMVDALNLLIIDLNSAFLFLFQ